jgi:hypothetical protein
MPTGCQGFTPTENVGRDFILRSTLPAQRAVSQPHQMEMPIQGIMPGKKSGNHPGLFPTEGQEFGPGAPRSTPEPVVGKDRGLAIAVRAGSPANGRSYYLDPALRPPRTGSGPTNLLAEPLLASLSAVSLPLTPACPGTQ